MKATQLLHNLGQSIWLDNITRDLLNSGTLKRYIDELSVTGLTSNPTIFDHAIKNSTAYDAAIREKLSKGKSGEALFFELALEDLTRAAALFRPVHDRTDGVDGWVSLEVSPLLAYDTASTLAAAKDLHARAGQNEPVHQDSRHQRRPARDRGSHLRRHPDQRHPAVLARAVSGGRRGIPARHRAPHRGRTRTPWSAPSPRCSSAAGTLPWRARCPTRCATSSASPSPSVPTRPTASCWIHRAWQRVFNAGARPQRLLWASTGTKDPKASDVLYVKALAAPFTVNTMPEGTLKALADHGELGTILPADGGDCEEVLAQFAKAGIDVDALAAQLQEEGAKSFVQSWNELMAVIDSKSAALKAA